MYKVIVRSHAIQVNLAHALTSEQKLMIYELQLGISENEKEIGLDNLNYLLEKKDP